MKKTIILLLLSLFIVQIKAQSPAAQLEAKQIATYVSPGADNPALEKRILQDLQKIRVKFGMEPISELDAKDKPANLKQITFIPAWHPGSIVVGLDSVSFDYALDGGFHGWDALNNRYDVNLITLLTNANAAVLEFNEDLNPQDLLKSYEAVKGIEWAEINQRSTGTSQIFPWKYGDRMLYLFDKAWEDCENGCKKHEYWFFQSNADGSIEYIGFWNAAQSRTYPGWWPRAKRIIDHFWKI